jgi:hypothetical protein
MGSVIRFERPVASLAVIKKLVDLGYLQPGARHRASAIERAIERLRRDLHRVGVIQTGDMSLIEAQNTPPRDETGGITTNVAK